MDNYVSVTGHWGYVTLHEKCAQTPLAQKMLKLGEKLTTVILPKVEYCDWCGQDENSKGGF